VLVDEPSPHAAERFTQIPDQFVGDLTDGLRLVRELGDVVSIIDASSTEALTIVSDAPRRSFDFDIVDTHVCGDVERSPLARNRVDSAFNLRQRLTILTH
jgi:hypothetical protein